jgi:hypothetical protein
MDWLERRVRKRTCCEQSCPFWKGGQCANDTAVDGLARKQQSMCMSTLAEIEAAADALPAEEQRALLRRLTEKLAHKNDFTTPWPVAPPAVPREELQRIHALVEAEFSRVDLHGW